MFSWMAMCIDILSCYNNIQYVVGKTNGTHISNMPYWNSIYLQNMKTIEFSPISYMTRPTPKGKILWLNHESYPDRVILTELSFKWIRGNQTPQNSEPHIPTWNPINLKDYFCLRDNSVNMRALRVWIIIFIKSVMWKLPFFLFDKYGQSDIICYL